MSFESDMNDLSPKLTPQMQKVVMQFHQELVRIATSTLLRANGMLRQAGIPLRYEVVAHDTSVDPGEVTA